MQGEAATLAELAVLRSAWTATANGWSVWPKTIVQVCPQMSSIAPGCYKARPEEGDPGTDFTQRQIDAAKELALAYEALNAAQLQLAIDSGALTETSNAKENMAGRS